MDLEGEEVKRNFKSKRMNSREDGLRRAQDPGIDSEEIEEFLWFMLQGIKLNLPPRK